MGNTRGILCQLENGEYVALRVKDLLRRALSSHQALVLMLIDPNTGAFIRDTSDSDG